MQGPSFKEETMRRTPLLIAPLALAAFTSAQAATVAEVFNGDMLGTNQRYFESIAGIPRESLGDEHTFRIQGCTLTATISNGSVTAMRLELAPSCQADLTTFIGDFAPPPGQPLTFGAFEQAAGSALSYSADCLTMCGNAYDPSVYGSWEGPRAVGFMEVRLEAMQVSDPAIDAASTWSEQMTQAMGEDWVIDARFNCDTRFNQAASQLFQDVPVTAVRIGTGLPSIGC